MNEFIEHFQHKIEKQPNGCMVWTGGRSQGYGNTYWKGKITRTHRLSLEAELGRPLRPGMGALHTCDNKPCVNPDHLYEGTQRQNARDAADRGMLGRYQAAKTHCPKGHPYDEANTIIMRRPDGSQSGRSCRICRSEWQKKYYQQAKERGQQ